MKCPNLVQMKTLLLKSWSLSSVPKSLSFAPCRIQDISHSGESHRAIPHQHREAVKLANITSHIVVYELMVLLTSDVSMKPAPSSTTCWCHHMVSRSQNSTRYTDKFYDLPSFVVSPCSAISRGESHCTETDGRHWTQPISSKKARLSGAGAHIFAQSLLVCTL
jgi:hypothetical protein